MSLSDCTQPRRVFPRWRCSSASFDLDEDYVHGVATPDSTNRLAVVSYVDRCRYFSSKVTFSILPVNLNGGS